MHPTTYWIEILKFLAKFYFVSIWLGHDYLYSSYSSYNRVSSSKMCMGRKGGDTNEPA